MCGAQSVQAVSAYFMQGAEYLSKLKNGLSRWLEDHEYDSLRQMCGSMNLSRCPNPREYERTNYVQILQAWD